MASSGVARRYAQAVFEIARQDDDLDTWATDLRTIRDTLEDSTTKSILENPVIPTDAKLALVAKNLHGLGEKQRNFAYVLVESHRTGAIADIASIFQSELDRLRGIVHARVTTAVHLSAEEQSDVTRRLEALTGRKVVMTTSVDPTILGGFVARIGDRLIDGSVVQRLNALRETLMA
jgi:F-type H+-transporting ATPase subunit delta